MERNALLNPVFHRLIALLFFISGIAGLTLQVVWMYKLGLIFGNASYATAATLTSFFLGLAIGGKYWGRKSSKATRPLRLYGLLELGIAFSALLVLPGIEFYQYLYKDIVLLYGNSKVFLITIKFLFSLLVLFVPTVLMGGTFPVLSQFIGSSHLASRATLLYTMNTLGAAIGTFLAGFFLFIQFGVQGTYIVSVCLASLAGIAAIILDKKIPDLESFEKLSNFPKLETKKSSAISISQFQVLAFSTGMLALATETAWIKMFTQVLQNSVYSFSVVLVVFLLSLALGGGYAHYLVKRPYRIQNVLFFLLLFSAFFVGCTPWVFDLMTNGLTYVGSTASWINYLISIFFLGLVVIGIPALILGTIFPYLIKANSILNLVPGNFIGRMVFLNSLGSAIGPLLLGFILIDLVGIWMSIKAISIGYVLLTVYFLKSSETEHSNWKIRTPILVAISILLFASPPLVRLEKGEKLLEAWQSADGIVSVVRSNDNVDMRLNNTYILGDAQSALVEQMQANVPLLIQPKPEKVLFLGMGTGITAGSALNHQVRQVDVVEIVSDVVPASKKYFSQWTNNLFTDNRVRIIRDDARNYLLGTNEVYDVIIGDLFSPWHSGTGGLYTYEHFEKVKQKLDKNGLFVQWLPMFQLTEEDFKSITVTFISVFPNTTFWRTDFSADKPGVALIGKPEGATLVNEVLAKNVKNMISKADSSSNHMAGLFYMGNILPFKDYLAGVALNTENRRSIEFASPKNAKRASAGEDYFMVGDKLIQFLDVLEQLPIEQDPYLEDLPSDELNYVKLGRLYFRYLKAKKENSVLAKQLLQQINEINPAFIK